MTAIAPVKNLQEWHTPSTRPEDIHELIQGVDRYNPTNLSFMEEYLMHQVREGGNDLLANLAILKLYQFNPHLANPEMIIHILIKALSSSVGGPDFTVCLPFLREPAAIIRDAESEDASLVTVLPWLQEINGLIRTCKFAEFWSAWNGSSEGAQAIKPFASQHANLVQTLRTEFATSISATFSRVKLAQLARWLGLQSAAEASTWAVEEAGWTVDGESAVVPGNGDNDVKAGVVKENIELGQLTKLVAAAAY